MKKLSTYLLGVYPAPLFPFVVVLVGCMVVWGLGAWIHGLMPPPSQRIYIPHQWACHSRYQGGYCERTGGYDRNGRPWGPLRTHPRGDRSKVPGESRERR